MGKRGPHLIPEHVKKIEELANRHPKESAASILERLQEEFPSDDPDSFPKDRTARVLVKKARPPDDSEPWSFAEADENDEDARLILDVLAVVLMEARFSRPTARKLELTQKEAKWVLQVHKAAPTLPPAITWQLAKMYLGREAKKESSSDLDVILATLPPLLDTVKDRSKGLSGREALEKAFGSLRHFLEEIWPEAQGSPRSDRRMLDLDLLWLNSGQDSLQDKLFSEIFLPWHSEETEKGSDDAADE